MSFDIKCDRCGRQFKRIQGLRSHQRRKTPCDLIVEDQDDEKDEKPFQCTFCKRRFTRIDHMERHMKNNCKVATLKNSQDGLESLCKLLIDKNAKQIAENSSLMASKGAPVNQTIIFNTNIITNQVININLFGEEDTKVLSALKLRKIVDAVRRDYPMMMIADGERVPFDHMDVIKGSLHVLMESAMIIYSNPEHPENITCYIPNKINDMAMVHAENGWELISQDLVLPKMANVTLSAILDSQPTIYEDGCKDLIGVSDYEPAMKAVRDVVNNFNKTGSMTGFKKILIKNRELLNQILGSLPVVTRIQI